MTEPHPQAAEQAGDEPEHNETEFVDTAQARLPGGEPRRRAARLARAGRGRARDFEQPTDRADAVNDLPEALQHGARREGPAQPGRDRPLGRGGRRARPPSGIEHEATAARPWPGGASPIRPRPRVAEIIHGSRRYTSSSNRARAAPSASSTIMADMPNIHLILKLRQRVV